MYFNLLRRNRLQLAHEYERVVGACADPGCSATEYGGGGGDGDQYVDFHRGGESALLVEEV